MARSVSDAIRFINIRLKVRGVVHRSTNVITPTDSTKSPYIQHLFVDEKDSIIITSYLTNNSPIDLQPGIPYELDLLSTNRYGPVSARIYKATPVENEALKAWYDGQYKNWVDRNTTLTKLKFVQIDPLVKSGKKNRVNVRGKIEFVGAATVCSTGASLHMYSIRDDSGSLSITIFGRENFVEGDVLSIRNLKIKEDKFTVDDLSDVYRNDAVEPVNVSQSSSQELFSATPPPVRSHVKEFSVSPQESPSKRMKIIFDDADSFYADLRSMYDQDPQAETIKKVLKLIASEEATMSLVGAQPLMSAFTCAIEDPKNENCIFTVIGAIFQSIGPPDKNAIMESEMTDQRPNILDFTIGHVFETSITQLDPLKLLQILLTMDFIPIESVFALLKAAIDTKDKKEARALRKEITAIFEECDG